jgi:hypothetical protein
MGEVGSCQSPDFGVEFGVLGWYRPRHRLFKDLGCSITSLCEMNQRGIFNGRELCIWVDQQVKSLDCSKCMAYTNVTRSVDHICEPVKGAGNSIRD